ncbi:Mo-dependent nitrogenase C-terminal domain-containing protein [Calothrix sp. PCC 6303]|uniref:Mo-dependent nitrogenase C-terminal domain-containing protein n=1 Tax=Calothrix sp. PCC 6303 TaxID=1170562 RepID=UPI0002A0226C|nr:Mo-dependent nitrogenase C-terminal domain-containing protein [Calothrix sp. PCC 6303]AFZ01014.1 Mo-dependent nitrogenase family protein [Calothrix sp. PCC 6303]
MIKTNRKEIVFSGFVKPVVETNQPISKPLIHQPRFAFLEPLRQWLDALEIQNPKTARLIAKYIPAQCPFERDITVFGHKIAHIPPLCKLNPLYDQFVGLRFRALCFLVDKCGEDIQSYC